MTDVKSEEFRRFILENREIIERILKDDLKESKQKTEEFVDENLDRAKAKAMDISDGIFKIAGDDDVQKHFITGCLEFLHFFEAVINAAPLSPEAREFVDKVEETRDKTVRNVVKTGADDLVQNIPVKEVKPRKAPAKKAKPKAESIKINDVKKKA